MSLPDLRPYQSRAVEHVRQVELDRYAKLGLQSPTGSGKTRILSELLLDPVPQLVLTHRRILGDQLSRVLQGYGIRHGLRMSGKLPDHAAPIQIALYQTEFSRAFKTDRFPKCKASRVHIDEAHSFGGGMARHVIEHYHEQGATVLCYTATPEELGDLIDELHVVATVPELIAGGYLVPPVIFGPDMPDMEKLESVVTQANGDFSPAGLKKIWDVKAVFGRVIEHYHKLNPEHKPTILYAPGVPQSLWFAQQLTASGVRAAHIDGNDVWLDGESFKSDTEARARIFEGVANGEIKVVCNRYVLREGLDIPQLECAILATSFGPRSAYEQSIGRVLRPYPGKTQAVIIDHGGNWLRHPPIESAEPWDYSLSAGVAARIRIEEMRIANGLSAERPEPVIREPFCCPQCAAIRVGGDACAQCGFRSTKSARRVLQVNGELRLQSGPAYKVRRTTNVPNAQKIWDRVFWGARKHRPDRTFQQVWSYLAYRQNWNYLPRELKRMPRSARGWFMPVGDVAFSELID